MYELVRAGDTVVIQLQPGKTVYGRDNLGELGDDVLKTIHRSHARVELLEGRVRLTRLGSNPMGVRCPGAEWRWIPQDEPVEIADGMELAFSKSRQFRTASTFALRHTPTVRPEAKPKSEPSGQPELVVKADPAPGDPGEPGNKPEATVKPEADVKPEPSSKREPGVKAEPSSKPEPGVKAEPSVKPGPSSQSRGMPAAPVPPASAAAAGPSPAAALASDSARHVFKAEGASKAEDVKAGASGKREHAEEAARSGGDGGGGGGGDGGGAGGGGKPSEKGVSRTLGEILREEEAAAASKRKRKAAPHKPAPPERRYDGDGRLYTHAEFVEYYGGELEWDAAPRKLPRKPAAAAAAQAQARAEGGDEPEGEPAAAAAAAAAATTATAAAASASAAARTSDAEVWSVPPDPDVLDLLVCAAGGWRVSDPNPSPSP